MCDQKETFLIFAPTCWRGFSQSLSFFNFLIELEILAFLHDVRYLLKVNSLEEKLSQCFSTQEIVLLFIWVRRCQFESGVGGVENVKAGDGELRWGKSEGGGGEEERQGFYVCVSHLRFAGNFCLTAWVTAPLGRRFLSSKDRWAVWGFKRFWESLQLRSKRQMKYLV